MHASSEGRKVSVNAFTSCLAASKSVTSMMANFWLATRWRETERVALADRRFSQPWLCVLRYGWTDAEYSRSPRVYTTAAPAADPKAGTAAPSRAPGLGCWFDFRVHFLFVAPLDISGGEPHSECP